LNWAWVLNRIAGREKNVYLNARTGLCHKEMHKCTTTSLTLLSWKVYGPEAQKIFFIGMQVRLAFSIAIRVIQEMLVRMRSCRGDERSFFQGQVLAVLKISKAQETMY